jgi:hypothetical protein
VAAVKASEKRKRDLEEFDFEFVLGARKQGSTVLFKLQWLGGKERWGTRWQTWEALPAKLALKNVGGKTGLEEKRALIKFVGNKKSLAVIGTFNTQKGKYYINYVGEEYDN